MADAQGGRAWLKPRSTLTYAGSPPTRTLVWLDSFDGAAADAPLAGRVKNGGTAGIGTWVRDDSNASSGADLLIDSSARTYQPAGGVVGGADHQSVYRITGLTLGADYDVEIDVERTSFVNLAGKTNGSVGSPVRMQDPAGSGSGELNYYYQYQTNLSTPNDDDLHGHWLGRAGGTAGTLTTGGGGNDHGINVGETQVIEVRVRGTGSDPGTCTTYIGGTPGGADGRVAVTFFDGQFSSPRVNYDSGPPGLRFFAGGVGEENSYRVKEIRIYEVTAGTSPVGGNEYGYGEVCVRHQTNVGSAFPFSLGYLVGAEFSHFGGPFSPIYLDFWFYAMTETGFVSLRGTDNGAQDFGILPPVFGVANPLTVEISDTHILTARWQGRIFLVFDCANPTYADGSDASADVPLVTGGVPALSLFDGDGVGTDIACTMFEVLAVSAPVPCEGPPENPYPWCPPPEPSTPSVYLYRMKMGRWRPTLVPVPSIAQAGDVNVTGGGRSRLATAMARMKMGRYRFPAVDTVDAIPPPPDTDLPPFYDPCNYWPVTPGELVDPIPFTGDRFIGLNNGPVSTLSTSFINGTMIAAGGWSVADIAAAAAKGCTVLTAQGGYSKFRSGGRWAGVSVYQAWASSTLVPMLGSLTNPAHYGFSMMDDFEAVSFWGPPNGIPLADMSFLVTWLHSVLPGVRIGVRALPSQFASNLGFDFYIAAFKAWGGISASGFRAREQGLAISRGSEILLGFNLIHGGDGSSGIRIDNGTMLSGHYCMSSAEIVAYSADIFTVPTNLVGSMNYQYGEPLFWNQPGIPDAMMTQRNDIAALP